LYHVASKKSRAKEAVVVQQREKRKWHRFTRLPNNVLQKVESPYELALLFVIRSSYLDDLQEGSHPGVCKKSLRTLGKEAKMSHHTVSKTIRSLLAKGLLEGEKRIPENGKSGWPCWHLTVPRSLWEENEALWEEERESEMGTACPKVGTRFPRVGTRETDFAENGQPLTTNKTNKNYKKIRELRHQIATHLLIDEGIASEEAERLASEWGLERVFRAAMRRDGHVDPAAYYAAALPQVRTSVELPTLRKVIPRHLRGSASRNPLLVRLAWEFQGQVVNIDDRNMGLPVDAFRSHLAICHGEE